MQRRKYEQEIREARGVIVLVQEDRFRLETPEGRSLLLILGNGAKSSVADLELLAKSHRTVTVRYRGHPDAGAVALDIRPNH